MPEPDRDGELGVVLQELVEEREGGGDPHPGDHGLQPEVHGDPLVGADRTDVLAVA